jgi:hypothetical protein
MFVGYAEFFKAWMVLVDTASELVTRESQDVPFDESCTCESLRGMLHEYPDVDVCFAASEWILNMCRMLRPKLKRR